MVAARRTRSQAWLTIAVAKSDHLSTKIADDVLDIVLGSPNMEAFTVGLNGFDTEFANSGSTAENKSTCCCIESNTKTFALLGTFVWQVNLAGGALELGIKSVCTRKATSTESIGLGNWVGCNSNARRPNLHSIASCKVLGHSIMISFVESLMASSVALAGLNKGMDNVGGTVGFAPGGYFCNADGLGR